MEDDIKTRIAALEAASKIFDPEGPIDLNDLLSAASTIERWLLTGVKHERVLKAIG
jgi:hypothetical protein